MQTNKTVALVLGSGGARGYAHIGVIEELEARGYEIICVSGCSMGALVGGVYAAGQLKAFKEWVTRLDYLDVLRLVDITWSPMGAMRGERVMEVISDLLAGMRIEDLPIAFTTVATDLLEQKEVWFQEGSLETAIRASIAVPGVITPVHAGNRILVDGGLVNPLPIIPTVSSHADLILAVNVTAQKGRATLNELMPDWIKRHRTPDMQQPAKGLSEWVKRVQGLAGQLLNKQASNEVLKEIKTEEQTPLGSEMNWSKLDLMLQSFEITQAALAQYKMAGYPPDIVVEIPKTVCAGYEFHKAPELIELGRRMARDVLDNYEQVTPLPGGDLDDILGV
ncbi:NTE family protein [Allopseudospirillum japonicum]|uniref:NTE family protein n=1 Tax=Allopseudospirillum japonicum TaxID=64971 RepID=A0A1H6RER1_9GAMM|nr:patatin-like phospholipase family protein [Allopseudospirillum japonicum]SEI54319.1 NTE family protein [Allopseudospirillum japonicum]